MFKANPFVISGYAGAQTFCDRVEETKRLISLIDNGNNIVLTAPRRVGKTDLISHVFAQKEIADRYITINVDVYATQNFAEFVLFIGKAIVDALRPKGKKLMDKFINTLLSLRSEITFDINGMPVWGIGVGRVKNPEITISEIFTYISEAEKPCLIAIDEFQQIAKYSDGGKVEALLRTYIQHTKNGRFIFSGSQQHLMSEMFVSPARPFYMSATLMNLPLIDVDVYADFCEEMFSIGDKHIDRACIYKTYEMFSGVTAYMQRVMNELYANTVGDMVCTADDLYRTVEMILAQASDGYEVLFYQLTERQRTMMLAIASNGGVANYSSSEFVRKYDLVSASSVRSSINTLLDKDLLTNNKGKIEIYDKFFELWLLHRFA